MKKKLVPLALLLFALGMAPGIYWIIYWNTHDALRASDYNLFIANYKNAYPQFLQALFPNKITLISIILLLISGILFFAQKKIMYVIIGIIAFVTSAWYLFTLM